MHEMNSVKKLVSFYILLTILLTAFSVSAEEPASIVFVIDHSFSMMGASSTFPGNDTYGARFQATRDMLDSIYRISPNSEVGLVVFREKLCFDHRNNNFAVALPGFDDQSYIPLIKLNSQQGSHTGLVVLQEMLKTDTVSIYNPIIGDSVECADLIYKPQFSTIGNTNVNIPFTAAKEAMKSADNPSERQYIVFIVDGEPHPVDSNSFDFVDGIQCPTTFTVYFSPDSGLPECYDSMTTNIQVNGYSFSNLQSSLYSMPGTYTDLMRTYCKNIFEIIFSRKIPRLIAYPGPTFERRPTLTWHVPEIPGTNYTITVAGNHTFNPAILTTVVPDTFYTVQSDLPVGLIYWRVKSDVSVWSRVSAFEILDNRVPVLIPHESPTTIVQPTLTWHTPPDNATAYTVQVSRYATFDTVLIDVPVSDTFYTCQAPLPRGTIYWRVKSNLVDSWSMVGCFYIQSTDVPLLIRYNGKKVTTVKPVFSWHPVPTATSYTILIADNIAFTNAVTVPLIDTVYIPPVALGDGRWFWKVSSSINPDACSPVDSLEIDTSITPITCSMPCGANGFRVVPGLIGVTIVIPPGTGGDVRLDVFNVKGRSVYSITRNNSLKKQLTWEYNYTDGTAVGSGMYILRLVAGEKTIIRKIPMHR